MICCRYKNHLIRFLRYILNIKPTLIQYLHTHCIHSTCLLLLGRQPTEKAKCKFFAIGFVFTATLAGWQVQFAGGQEISCILVASIAEVGGAPAKPHRHITAVAALVLDKLFTMFWACVYRTEIRTCTAYKLGLIKFANVFLRYA